MVDPDALDRTLDALEKTQPAGSRGVYVPEATWLLIREMVREEQLVSRLLFSDEWFAALDAMDRMTGD